MSNTEENLSQRQAKRLLDLLQLERDARCARNERELVYLAVNETNRLLNYSMAVFWRSRGEGRARVEAASGNKQIDGNAPFMVWLRGRIHGILRGRGALSVRAIDGTKGGKVTDASWMQWSPPQILWMPLVTPSGHLMGGLWCARGTPWSEGEIELATRLAEAYAHALVAFRGGRGEKSGGSVRWRRWVLLGLAAAIVAVMFIPVSQWALAPAAVSARNPLVVTAPLEGVIKEVLVEPNQTVSRGRDLFQLDPAELGNQIDVARTALASAKADHLRHAQLAFTQPESKARLAEARIKIKYHTSEVEFLERRLGELRVRAPRDGVAVFSDPNDWRGKPVRVGERVMLIAHPSDAELEVWLPTDEPINLEIGARVQVFLNVAPLDSLEAVLTEIEYEPVRTPEGFFAYRLFAEFRDAGAAPRIGLKATAKIFSRRVSLFYFLFRRPMAFLRHNLGI